MGHIRFQYILCCCLTKYPFQCNYACIVSIHLMLLFNKINQLTQPQTLKFQYILCCCLTSFCSYVWLGKVIVSIHLMLLFNYKLYCGFDSHHSFQYILCCCLTIRLLPLIPNIVVSIHLMLLFNKEMVRKKYGVISFNTSYVVV